MEARLAEAEACIEYSDPIEPKLHNEQEREFPLQIQEEPIDESVTVQEETKEFEFKVVEYTDNSNRCPPPEEPISSENIFDNFDENSKTASLTVPIPISQPSKELITNNGKMEDNVSLSIPNHYEQWLAFHHDNPIQKFIKNLQGLLDFEV